MVFWLKNSFYTFTNAENEFIRPYARLASITDAFRMNLMPKTMYFAIFPTDFRDVAPLIRESSVVYDCLKPDMIFPIDL